MSDEPQRPAPDGPEDAYQNELLLTKAVDSFTDPMFIKDRRHRWIAGNTAFFALLGRQRHEVLYKSDPDFFPPEQVEVFWRYDDILFESGQPSENEERLTGAGGIERVIWTRKYPLRDDAGQVIALSGIITDITNIRSRMVTAVRLEAELAEQQRVIASQEALLSKLAVPVIQIWDGILLLPMVGEITAQRAAQVMESLLAAITQHRTRFALIDITGVPVVDGTVASYLVKTVQAVRLLGCQCVTVGIGAGVAAELVKLGIDVSALLTQATLQQGLVFAIQQLSKSGDRGTVPARR
jgi:rsbT co-antagonist protein RsbR